ncbi:UPF0496 protein At4g34320-like [Carya illinoinensis]|uniref:Uncharacterized protein n=1 Tax=Carya illinoinensis TaxID=32201 RepID=A0A922FW39_CARIL|nr:UPF0496 protein At4g34320-like [Carya illinoinensis]XP_042975626.1 UPF0496 protein At4g34320-like [Carya illinoinensis]KAG6729538.1 hypothetical protein I3842_01G033000 [Carya illinoinensis]
MVSNSSKTHFTADMSAHEVARELDVDLESGDAIVVVEPQLVSSDSIKEIVKCLYEMHLEMANFNLKCKEDIWNNQEFFLFLKDYFQNSLRASNFCTALEDCLERRRDNYKSIVQSAVKHFEEEVEDGVNGVKYMKTLQELSKFKDAEDPFTDEFFRPFPSFYEQHESVLDKLQLRKTELDKKLEHEKTRRSVFIFILWVVFVSSVLMVVLAANKSTPNWGRALTAALTAALSNPMGNLGIEWCNSFFKSRQSALEGKRGVISSMRDGTRTTKKDLGNIKALIDKLQIETVSMLKTADCALGEEEAVKVVIDAIQKELEMFMNAAQNLRDNAYRCRRDSVRWRKFVLQSMFRSVRD